jgi:hypothetical protein
MLLCCFWHEVSHLRTKRERWRCWIYVLCCFWVLLCDESEMGLCDFALFCRTCSDVECFGAFHIKRFSSEGGLTWYRWDSERFLRSFLVSSDFLLHFLWKFSGYFDGLARDFLFVIIGGRSAPKPKINKFFGEIS